MFKVGDKVKVREDLKIYKDYDRGCTFVSSMSIYMGKTMRIKKVLEGKYGARYKLENGDNWSFSKSMLKPLKNSIRRV